MKKYQHIILIIIILGCFEDVISQNCDTVQLLDKISNDPQQYDNYFNYFDCIKHSNRTSEHIALQGLNKAKLDYDTFAVFQFTVELAQQYVEREMHGNALVYFQKALEIQDISWKNPEQVGEIYIQMGNIYFQWKDFAIAREYYLNACSLFENTQDKNRITLCYNLLGTSEYNLNDFSSSAKNFLRSLEISESIGNLELTIRNIIGLGKIEYSAQLHQSALEYFDEALHRSRDLSNPVLLTTIKINLAAIYIDLGNLQKAQQLIDEAIVDARANSFSELEMICVKLNSEILAKLGNNYQAIRHFQQYVELRDSFYNAKQHKTIAELRAQYEFLNQEKIIEKQNKKIELLQQQKRITNTKVYLLSGGFILILAISFLVRKRLRSAFLKDSEMIENSEKFHKSYKSLVRAQMMTARIEKQQLSDEIELRNRELLDITRNKIKQNELMINLLSELKKLNRLGSNIQDEEIKSLSSTLTENIAQKQEYSNLDEYLNNLNREFISNLEHRFPSLTLNEKKLAVFLRLGHSTKEMAELLNTSVKAVEMARYRLRRKLELTNSENLHRFFQNL